MLILIFFDLPDLRRKRTVTWRHWIGCCPGTVTPWRLDPPPPASLTPPQPPDAAASPGLSKCQLRKRSTRRWDFKHPAAKCRPLTFIVLEMLQEVFGTVKAMAAFTKKKIYYCTENLVSFIKLFSIREIILNWF